MSCLTYRQIDTQLNTVIEMQPVTNLSGYKKARQRRAKGLNHEIKHTESEQRD